jgi:hypothetical protein
MSMAEGKASVRTIDMSNVKDGGGTFNKRRVVAGDYEGKIVKVEDAKVKKGDNEGEFQYLFTIVLSSHPANKYPYYCTLVANQLWKLRNLFIAAGKQVPKKKVKLDPNVIVGKTIGVTMEDDEYEGKAQSVIAAVFPASELSAVESDDDEDDATDDEDESETEEDEDTSTDTEEDEDEEEEDDAAEGDEYDAMDRAALKKAIKKIDDSFRITKSMTDDDLRGALRAANEDDEEEDEPAPAPKKAKKKKDEVTDDDLEELDIDDV